MAANIQFRRDISNNWTIVNPILAEGELGLELDTKFYKIGDGISNWNTLTYAPLNGTLTSLMLDATTDPTPPLTDSLQIYAKEVAGKIVPKYIGPSGLDTIIQESFAGNGIIMAGPGTTTALSYFGQGAFTAVGTLSHPAIAATSVRESTRRGIVTSTATANSASELRQPISQVFRGGSPNIGGFFITMRFGISSTVPTQRLAVGLFNITTAIATTVEPSTLVNGIWVGNDLADANLQLMHNDAAGVAIKIDLGSDFVKNQPNAIYELILFCKANDSKISYRVKRLDAAGEVSGELTTEIPLSTVALTPHYYANNGGTAAAVILDFYRYYLLTDY